MSRQVKPAQVIGDPTRLGTRRGLGKLPPRFPRRFRDEWSQPVAGPTQPAATPHNHNAISSTAEGEPTVAENHSHQQHRPITKLSAPPRCCTRPTIPWVYSQDSFPSSPPLLLSSLFITSLVTSRSLFHFFLAALPSLPPSSPTPPRCPLSFTTPSCPMMDIGGVISRASVIFPYHIFY